MSKLDKLDQLNLEWKDSRSYSPFVCDGILIEDDWERASPKIMFLMKESYKNSDWWKISGSPIGSFQKGPIDKIWENILRWRYLLTSYFNDETIPEFPSIDTVISALPNKESLSDIAYLNVSKELGESTTNQKQLQDRAIQDSDYLTKQIDIIDPDVVLCARTFWCYHTIYEENKTIEKISENLYYHKDRLVIDFFHPGKPAGNKDRELYAKLSGILESHKATLPLGHRAGITGYQLPSN